MCVATSVAAGTVIQPTVLHLTGRGQGDAVAARPPAAPRDFTASGSGECCRGGRREREVARVAGAEEALDGCCPMQSLLDRASKGQNLHYEGKQQGLQTQLARPAAAAAAAGARRPCALPRTACMSTLGAVIR